jgi:hypothetical protein
MFQSRGIVEAALGKKVALVLWGTTETGEDDVAVYSRKLSVSDSGYTLVHTETGHEIPLEEDWLSRLQAVPKELQPILLECEYQIQLTVGNVDESQLTQLEPLGIKWPDSSNET